MIYKIEFDSGECLHCYAGLVNKPMHYTECIYTSIGGDICHNRIDAEFSIEQLGDCSIRVLRS